MNRARTERAELELDRSEAWRDLHAECFRDIFAPGSGVSFTAAYGAYEAWCRTRQVWASSAILRRQLARAGYSVQDERILGVQLSGPEECGRVDEVGVQRAANFLGIEAGLLRSLRDFGEGPPFGSGPKGISYPMQALDRWRAELDRERYVDRPELWRCLEEICRFRAIEDRHFFRVREIETRACWARVENAVGSDKFAIRNDPAWLSHEREWDHQRYEHDCRTGSLRLVEADLLAAVTQWYMNQKGAAPCELRAVLREMLPPLQCKLARPKPTNGVRQYEWRGVGLRSAETSALTLAFDSVRGKSGLHITVSSLVAVTNVTLA